MVVWIIIMPKKFKGENSKAVVAKERKSAAREEAEQERKRKEEDEYWRDDNKLLLKKQERMADKERKRQEQLDRKKASKLMLEDEESKLTGKTSCDSGGKVTRAQILKETEQQISEGACALPKGVVTGSVLEQNPNHLILDRGELEARTVEEAIDLLSVLPQEKVDKHPEKRLKAAYAVFEARELPRLKAENPNLRQSQVKQLIRKEWMKSSENPMNQSSA